ncbi:MAG: ABC transporter permease [Pseudomonadota bacterium]
MGTSKSKLKLAVKDFSVALNNRRLWMVLGWNDVQTRYNRSKLGVLWASLSILIFISALGPIYASLFEVGLRDFTLHLLLGLVIWNYVSAIIMESGREYINGANYLISFQLSYGTLLLRVVWRNFVVLCYQLVVFVLVALSWGHMPNASWLVAPIALVFITLNALWMALLMSVVATRFRDFSELLNNILRLVFFVTPIMWMPSMKADLQWVAEINPFYHLIESFRAPLQSGTVESNHWLVMIWMFIFGSIIAFPIFAKYRARIAYWL